MLEKLGRQLHLLLSLKFFVIGGEGSEEVGFVTKQYHPKVMFMEEGGRESQMFLFY